MPSDAPAVPDRIEGRVAWIYGDDYDADLIIGVQNIKRYEAEFLLSVCMAHEEPDFVSKVQPGDVLVGGRNFGYGHPHYPAMIAVREAGIAAVVAESFAPGFARGETFNGMPLITCPGITGAVQRWDGLQIDWPAGTVHNTRTSETLKAEVPSERVAKVWRAGGSMKLLLAERGRLTAA